MSTLFNAPVTTKEDRIEQSAAAFHAANPHIKDELIAVCLRAKGAGLTRWSINAAFEVVRYNSWVTTHHQLYKLCNTHRAVYARWIMRDVPALAGFFKTKRRKISA